MRCGARAVPAPEQPSSPVARRYQETTPRPIGTAVTRTTWPRHLALLLAGAILAAAAAPAQAAVGAPPAPEDGAVITSVDLADRGAAAAALADLAVAVRGPLAGDALTDTSPDDPAAVLHALGVVHGRADGSFGGDAPLQRGQLASLAARLLAELRGAAATGTPLVFSDVAGHPHAAGIADASRDGLVAGRPDGTFGPSDTATARQLETVVARLRGVLEAEGLLVADPMPDPIVATFDTADGSFRVLIDQPAAIDLLAAAEPGTHIGIPNGRILPGDGGVNVGHDWHLVEVEIVDMTMELCDGTAAYLDDIGFDAWYDAHGDRFCPWSAVYLGGEPAPTA